jgi:hypothetical protein
MKNFNNRGEFTYDSVWVVNYVTAIEVVLNIQWNFTFGLARIEQPVKLVSLVNLNSSKLFWTSATALPTTLSSCFQSYRQDAMLLASEL